MLLLLSALVLVVGRLRRQMHQDLPRRHQLRFPRKNLFSVVFMQLQYSFFTEFVKTDFFHNSVYPIAQDIFQGTFKTAQSLSFLPFLPILYLSLPLK